MMSRAYVLQGFVLEDQSTPELDTRQTFIPDPQRLVALAFLNSRLELLGCHS